MGSVEDGGGCMGYSAILETLCGGAGGKWSVVCLGEVVSVPFVEVLLHFYFGAYSSDGVILCDEDVA